jgi:hypothetical protein
MPEHLRERWQQALAMQGPEGEEARRWAAMLWMGHRQQQEAAFVEQAVPWRERREQLAQQRERPWTELMVT